MCEMQLLLMRKIYSVHCVRLQEVKGCKGISNCGHFNIVAVVFGTLLLAVMINHTKLEKKLQWLDRHCVEIFTRRFCSYTVNLLNWSRLD